MPAAERSLRVVIIDNYDSYVWNLFQAVGELTGHEAQVVRHDAVDLAGLRALAPTHVLLSPGPGNPADPGRIGVCAQVLEEPNLPVLGVCLGHQALGLAHGARVGRASRVMHGKTSLVHLGPSRLFAGLPTTIEAMRYHSLVLERASLPPALALAAWTDEGVVMAIEHRERPHFGVQFHPESIGTVHGPAVLANFLALPRPQH